MQEFYNEVRDLTKDTLTLLREVETAHTKLDAVGTISSKTKAVIDETYDAPRITETIDRVSTEITDSKIQTGQGLQLVKEVQSQVQDHNVNIVELSAAIENNLITAQQNHKILEQTMTDGATKTDENLTRLDNHTTDLHESVKNWIHNPIFEKLESTKSELTTAVIEIEKNQNEQMKKLNAGYDVLSSIVQNLENEITKYRVTNTSVLQTVNLLNRLADGIDNKIESASPTIGIKTAEELENIFEQNSSSVSLEDLVKRLETTITPPKEPLRVFVDGNDGASVKTLDYTESNDDINININTNSQPPYLKTEVNTKDMTTAENAVDHEEVEHEDVQPEDVNSKDVKPEDVNSEYVKPEDVKPEDVKPEDVNSEDVKPEDVKPEDVKPEEVETEDVKLEDIKHEEVETKEDKLEDIKSEGVNIAPVIEIDEPIKVEFPEPSNVEPVKEEKHGFFSKFFGMKG